MPFALQHMNYVPFYPLHPGGLLLRDNLLCGSVIKLLMYLHFGLMYIYI